MVLSTLKKIAPLFSQSFLKLWQVVRMIVAVEVGSLEAFGHSFQTAVILMGGGSGNGPDFRCRKLLKFVACILEDVLEMLVKLQQCNRKVNVH